MSDCEVYLSQVQDELAQARALLDRGEATAAAPQALSALDRFLESWWTLQFTVVGDDFSNPLFIDNASFWLARCSSVFEEIISVTEQACDAAAISPSFGPGATPKDYQDIIDEYQRRFRRPHEDTQACLLMGIEAIRQGRLADGDSWVRQAVAICRGEAPGKADTKALKFWAEGFATQAGHLGVQAQALPGEERRRQLEDALKVAELALLLDPVNPKARQVLDLTKSDLRGTSGGCFIATAACGSPFAWEVVVLQAFRDRVLMPTTWGGLIIRTYYRVSPLLARAIRNQPVLRLFVRGTIVRPCARFAARFLSLSR